MWSSSPPAASDQSCSSDAIQQPTTEPQQTPTATEAIDLYFNCANSINQWYALYKYGRLEDCSPYWQNFKHALLKKTRLQVEPAPPQPSRWERRTPAEAQQAWLQLYGDPDEAVS